MSLKQLLYSVTIASMLVFGATAQEDSPSITEFQALRDGGRLIGCELVLRTTGIDDRSSAIGQPVGLIGDIAVLVGVNGGINAIVKTTLNDFYGPDKIVTRQPAYGYLMAGSYSSAHKATKDLACASVAYCSAFYGNDVLALLSGIISSSEPVIFIAISRMRGSLDIILPVAITNRDSGRWKPQMANFVSCASSLLNR